MEDHDTLSESLEFEVVSRRLRTVGCLDIESSGYGWKRKETFGSLGSIYH